MKKIAAEDFLKAFSEEWKTRQTNIEVLQKYEDNKEWTKFLFEQGGFLESVMRWLHPLEPGVKYRTEYYTIDALYVAGEDLLGTNFGYPPELHVLIENEHGENIEEEMWKLIHWRSPLKVIIFYDWNEDSQTTEHRRNWVASKLQKLRGMMETVNAFWPETPETEYLFLVANREKTPEEGWVSREIEPEWIPRWRWATNVSWQLEWL